MSNSAPANAITHGLFAKHLRLSQKHRPVFLHFTEQIQAEFQPQGPTETFYVEFIVDQVWRLRFLAVSNPVWVRRRSDPDVTCRRAWFGFVLSEVKLWEPLFFAIGCHPLGARWVQEHYKLDPEASWILEGKRLVPELRREIPLLACNHAEVQDENQREKKTKGITPLIEKALPSRGSLRRLRRRDKPKGW